MTLTHFFTKFNISIGGKYYEVIALRSMVKTFKENLLLPTSYFLLPTYEQTTLVCSDSILYDYN